MFAGFTLGLVVAATAVHALRIHLEDTQQQPRQAYDVAMDVETGDAWLCAPSVFLRGRVRGAGWITVVVEGEGDRTPSLPTDGAYRPDPVCSLSTLGVGHYSVWSSRPPGEGDGYFKVGFVPARISWQRT